MKAILQLLLKGFWQAYRFFILLSGKRNGLLRKLELGYLRHCGIRIGQNLRLGLHVTFSIGRNAKLSIGDNVIIGDYTWIQR